MSTLVTSIHRSMRRCLLADNGAVSAYLDASDSALLANTSFSALTAGAGTSGMTVIASGFVAGDVGKYIVNTTRGFRAMIKTVVSSTEVECYPPMDTVLNRWGATTSTTTDKLVASAGDFVNRNVEIGNIAALRDLTNYGVITAVDSATQLSVDNDIFPSGTNYSICKGFVEGDSISKGTAVLDGTAGQVMVEIPAYWVDYKFLDDQHSWAVSQGPRAGYAVHPAFKRADGSVRDAIYIGAYEGAIAMRDFANDVLTDYNLGTAELQSAAGHRAVVNGQRSEFRTVTRNRGAGWHQMDWFDLWAYQLLFILEYGNLNSQATLGDGYTNWGGTERDAFVVNTNNRACAISGWSVGDGNNSANGTTPANHVGGYISYRGIENPWGNVWKFIDGVNYLDGRVYLSFDPENFADDIGSGAYFDTGLNQPTSNGFIREIHDSPYGFIVKSSTGGSATTYIPDQYFYNTGFRVALSGGFVAAGANAGFAALSANSASSSRSASVGARACFK